MQNEIGRFFAKARKSRGMTQGELARRLGYSTPQCISNWERGLINPPVNSLRKLSKALDVNVNEIKRLYVEDFSRSLSERLS